MSKPNNKINLIAMRVYGVSLTFDIFTYTLSEVGEWFGVSYVTVGRADKLHESLTCNYSINGKLLI
jgi:hypothetical protein